VSLLFEMVVESGDPEGALSMVFHVTMEQAEDGWFVVECPALPGCVSQGKTEAEALSNIREAIIAWLWAEDQKASLSLTPELKRQPMMVTV
jgi:predicted RNase H-like HicB family nuclease